MICRYLYYPINDQNVYLQLTSNGRTGFSLQDYSLHASLQQLVYYVNRGTGVLGLK